MKRPIIQGTIPLYLLALHTVDAFSVVRQNSPQHERIAFTSRTSSFLQMSTISESSTDTGTITSSSYPLDIVKPTGTSFLPSETIERAQQGSPIEKIKLEKDGINAFVDVYEYARKIRDGEMTWEEVDKADLDSVRYQRRTTTTSIVRFDFRHTRNVIMIV